MSVMMDSIQYKLNAFKETWTSIAQQAISSDFMKDIVDQGTRLLEIIEKDSGAIRPLFTLISNLAKILVGVTNTLGTLGSVFSSVIIVGLLKGKNVIGNLLTSFITTSQSVKTFTSAMAIAGSTTMSSSAKIEQLSLMADGLTDKQLRLAISTANLSSSQQKLMFQLTGLTEKEASLKVQTLGVTTAETTATGATFSFRGALQGLWATIVANPIGALVTAVMTVVTAITIWKQKQEKLREQAIENAKASQDEISELGKLVSQYEAILDSEKSEADKTQELNEWKNTLIDTYGFEKEKLAELNTEREKGIELLNGEIDASQRVARNKYLSDYEKEIAKAEKKLGGFRYDTFSSTAGFYSGIDERIIKLFDRNDIGDFGATLTFNADDAYDELEKLTKIFNQLTDIKSRRELTMSESELFGWVEAMLAQVNADIESLGTYYETGSDYKAQNIFQDYFDVKSISDDIRANGVEAYNYWRNGLLSQAESPEQKRELLSIIEKQFPKSEEYLKNYKSAENRYLSGIFDNSLKAYYDNWIKSLSDEDLAVIVSKDFVEKFPNLFEQGLDGAKAKLDEWKSDPDNVIPVTFNVANYQEGIETVTKNIGTLQDAIAKLDKGNLDTSDIASLIKAFPEYSTQILAAQGDTAKLKSILQDMIKTQPQPLIDSLTELKDSLTDEEDIKAVDNLISILNSTAQTSISVTSLSDALKDLSDKESLLSSVWKEMNTDGQLSVSTYQKLIDTGIDFSDVIDITNGVITTSVEDIKKLIKKDYELSTATLEAEKAQLSYNAAVAGASGEDVTAYVQRISQINEEIKKKKAETKTIINMLDSYDYTSEDKGKDKNKEAFEKEYNKRKHLLEIGKISEQEYIDWLDGAYKQYFSDLTKYQDEYNKYEEEVYKSRKSREQDLFETKISNYEKLADKALDDKLDDLGGSSKWDYARAQYENAIADTQARIDALKASGLQNVDEEIKKLEESLDKYANKIEDINKKELKAEQDYIKELKSDYDDLMDDRADKIKKFADETEKAYEKQIDAIDKQIKAIDKANKKQEQQKKILDAQKGVIEAQANLEKARREDAKSSYVALSSGGTMTVVDTHENEEKAKEELQKAQQALQEAYQEDVKSNLEAQKDILEEQKKNSKEYYDTISDNLKEQKKKQDDIYDSLVKIYEKMGGDGQSTSNADLVNSLDSSKIAGALDKLSDKDKQSLTDAGILLQDKDGKLSLNYEATDKNTKAVEELTQTVKDADLTVDDFDPDYVKYSDAQLVKMFTDAYKSISNADSYYGKAGHEGNVDYNHRIMKVNDDGSYNTILGNSFTYAELAKTIKDYIGQNNNLSEQTLGIFNEILDIANKDSNKAFTFTPMNPDGKFIVKDAFNGDELLDYIVSQMVKGIRLEDMSNLMGKNFASKDEALKDAFEKHELNAKDYDIVSRLAIELLDRGYNIDQLKGVLYEGDISDLDDIKNALTQKVSPFDMYSNTVPTDKNTLSTDNNTSSLEDLTKVLSDENSTEEDILNVLKGIAKSDEKTEENGWTTVGGSQSNVSAFDVSRTDKGLVRNVNGAPLVDGHKVKLATKKQDDNKSFAGYGNFADMIKAMMNGTYKPDTNIANQMMNSNIKNKIGETTPSGIVNNVTNHMNPIINNNITIEGNADQKTVEAMQNVVTGEILKAFKDLDDSINARYAMN